MPQLTATIIGASLKCNVIIVYFVVQNSHWWKQRTCCPDINHTLVPMFDSNPLDIRWGFWSNLNTHIHIMMFLPTISWSVISSKCMVFGLYINLFLLPRTLYFHIWSCFCNITSLLTSLHLGSRSLTFKILVKYLYPAGKHYVLLFNGKNLKQQLLING